MHRRTLLISIATLLTLGTAHGENISQATLESRIDDIIDAYYSMSDQTDENASEEVFAMLREKLEERLENKIVINNNKRLKEELESLQFLSALQIDAICGYIENNGKAAKKYKNHAAVLRKGNWVWHKVQDMMLQQARLDRAQCGMKSFKQADRDERTRFFMDTSVVDRMIENESKAI